MNITFTRVSLVSLAILLLGGLLASIDATRHMGVFFVAFGLPAVCCCLVAFPFVLLSRNSSKSGAGATPSVNKKAQVTSPVLGSQPAQKKPVWRPPSKSNLERATKLGIPISARMSSSEVAVAIMEAAEKPENAGIVAHLREEMWQQQLQSNIATWGRELAEEEHRWARLFDCNRFGHYVLAFTSGDSRQVEVVEQDYIQHDGQKLSSLKIVFLRPKIRKYESSVRSDPRNNYLEWEVELKLRPKQILALMPVDSTFAADNINRYRALIASAQKELAEKNLVATTTP